LKEFSKSIELARALWERNYETRCQHFSFVFYKGRLLTIGRNKIRTHPTNLKNPTNFDSTHSKGICSELAAAIKLKNKTDISFSKLIMINVRLDKNLNVKMSRPCSSCQNLIAYLKPKQLYFTDDEGKFQLY